MDKKRLKYLTMRLRTQILHRRMYRHMRLSLHRKKRKGEKHLTKLFWCCFFLSLFVFCSCKKDQPVEPFFPVLKKNNYRLNYQIQNADPYDNLGVMFGISDTVFFNDYQTGGVSTLTDFIQPNNPAHYYEGVLFYSQFDTVDVFGWAGSGINPEDNFHVQLYRNDTLLFKTSSSNIDLKFKLN